jgi:hypothetical protein
MPFDFTLKKLTEFYQALSKKGYRFLTFSQYLQNKPENKEKIVILRHDVDRNLTNTIKIANLEKEMGITCSYYFRHKKNIFNEKAIRYIFDLGHEIGYHYEVLSKTKGDLNQGIHLFKKELEDFRKIVPIHTICMHGSPLSRWDSKVIWEKFKYKELGIIGEPYFDIDYHTILYLTDTGRRWDANKSNLRDKVESSYRFNFRSTNQILYALGNKELPPGIMINIHPHRWCNNFFSWSKELVLQNMKNIVKSTLKKLR